jgi:hypothetical protein
MEDHLSQYSKVVCNIFDCKEIPADETRTAAKKFATSLSFPQNTHENRYGPVGFQLDFNNLLMCYKTFLPENNSDIAYLALGSRLWPSECCHSILITTRMAAAAYIQLEPGLHYFEPKTTKKVWKITNPNADAIMAEHAWICSNSCTKRPELNVGVGKQQTNLFVG